MRFNLEPVGNAALWGIFALAAGAPAFGLLSAVRARSLVVVPYGTYHWVLVAAVTFPVLLSPLAAWAVAARSVTWFQKLERSRTVFILAMGLVAAFSIALRTAMLEWPIARIRPLSMFNSYYATEWLAFWFGLVVPRLITSGLRLGTFLPRRTAQRCR